jgi:hypothetical protein
MVRFLDPFYSQKMKLRKFYNNYRQKILEENKHAKIFKQLKKKARN